MQVPTYEDVVGAARRLSGHVVRTRCCATRCSTSHRRHHPAQAGALQRTGSFKLRGATNAALQLSEAERRAGVVTHSSGNHGQALACAAAGVGTAATIFMPRTRPA